MGPRARACVLLSMALLMGAITGPSTGSGQTPPNAHLSGVVHLQDIGDVPFKDRAWNGTKGESRRLEGFSLRIDPPVDGLGIEYMCHFQDRGDTPWMPGGDFCGTRGESRRLEGFAIRLTGPNASKYRVWYQCHLQDKGDSAAVQGGGFCGTRGESRRLEAMYVSVARGTKTVEE